MKRTSLPFWMLISFTLFSFLQPYQSHAQRSKKNEKLVLPQKDIDNYKDQALGLIKFYQGTLNFLGDTVNLPVEKETIINQSWNKIFESKKTQIEDDLVPDRFVPVNKDVQAYLKDIDFFYKYAHFDFDIEEIDFHTTPEGKMFFKAKLNRKLFALSAYNDTTENDRLRYIEINLDPLRRDLKIASVYTTRINIREELQNWWNGMSLGWRNYFGDQIMISDTNYSKEPIRLSDVVYFTDTLSVVLKAVPDSSMVARVDSLIAQTDTNDLVAVNAAALLADSLLAQKDYVLDTTKLTVAPIMAELKKLIRKRSIDVSGIQDIDNLDPMDELSDLEVLICAQTRVSDLSPLRNLSKLKTLDASETYIGDIAGLRYLSSLQDLKVINTKLKDLSPLTNLNHIRRFDASSCPIKDLTPLIACDSLNVLRLSDTEIKDISPLASCKGLQNLDISKSRVSDLSPLADLKRLSVLNIESTLVTDISPLSDLENLSSIQMSSSRISDLSPLNGLPKLRRIYAESTRVTADEANAFMRKNRGSLVIFESNALKQWWSILPEEWKTIFKQTIGFEDGTPDKEDLHEIIRLPELDLAANQNVSDLYPLSRLVNLRKLNLSECPIDKIEALADLVNLESLNISKTNVSNIDPIANITGLTELWADYSKIDHIDTLKSLKDLKILSVDDCPLTEEQIDNFRQASTNCIVVFDSNRVEFWWNNLNELWQDLLTKAIGIKGFPNRLDLARVIHLKTLELGHQPDLMNLSPLKMFVHLEDLRFEGTRISSLEPIRHLTQMKVLIAPNNPINDLEPLGLFIHLEKLNLQNTQIESLKPIALNLDMKVLDISGTRIKSLRPLSSMFNMEDLSIYNTKVRSISPLKKWTKLKHFKCYNTRISEKTIKKFEDANPGTEVVFY